MKQFKVHTPEGELNITGELHFGTGGTLHFTGGDRNEHFSPAGWLRTYQIEDAERE